MVFSKYFCDTLAHSKSSFPFGGKCSFIKKCDPKSTILKRKRLKQTPKLNYAVIVKESTPSPLHPDPVPIQVKKPSKAELVLIPHECGTTEMTYKSD